VSSASSISNCRLGVRYFGWVEERSLPITSACGLLSATSVAQIPVLVPTSRIPVGLSMGARNYLSLRVNIPGQDSDDPFSPVHPCRWAAYNFQHGRRGRCGHALPRRHRRWILETLSSRPSRRSRCRRRSFERPCRRQLRACRHVGELSTTHRINVREILQRQSCLVRIK
jgi:hypothetical protein